MTILEDTISEGLNLSEPVLAPVAHYGESVGETVRLAGVAYWANLFSSIASDALELSEAGEALVGAVVIERLNLAESFFAGGLFGSIYVESLQLGDAASIARQATVLESLALSEAQLVSRGIHIVETLGLAETIAEAARYGLSYADGLLLTDRILRFIGGEISDTLQLTEAVAGHQRARREASDVLELSESISPKFLLSAVAADTLELTAEHAIQMLFHPHLREGVVFSGAYISPGGGFTAWSMNTRTAAVSEYTNFEFNSFAAFDNKYLAASNSGLFELNGDTDNGEDIIAQIKSGYLQFGGVKLSRLKAAYIGARGDGDFVLRIITGAGQTYNYAASTRDMQTTKVNMGKGQRARYFAFELISAGQDFDLDSIEFVPIVVQRRV